MGTYNKITIMGRLGADPEIKTVGGGKKIAKLSVATDKRAKDSKPDWHNVTVWERQADICEQYLHKGEMVLIEGRVEYREHEGKWFTDIIASDVVLIGGGKQDNAPRSPFD